LADRVNQAARLAQPWHLAVYPIRTCDQIRDFTAGTAVARGQLAPFPVAINFDKADFAQPLELRFDVEQFR
jgi:hypothetical protein